ncbi:MAG TPA: hypothetical protein PLF31_00240 [Candidatus Paceibacterota bacterium]|nr:hypothetical protein [Candidatus Paceibacterota bacterium]
MRRLHAPLPDGLKNYMRWYGPERWFLWCFLIIAISGLTGFLIPKDYGNMLMMIGVAIFLTAASVTCQNHFSRKRFCRYYSEMTETVQESSEVEIRNIEHRTSDIARSN